MLNRTLPREHYRQFLTEVLKPVLLEKWKAEATYHQRLLYKICRDFYDLKYFDEDIWTQLIFDIGHKSKINNLHFFDCFWNNLQTMNKDPKNPFFGKINETLKAMETKHFNRDR